MIGGRTSLAEGLKRQAGDPLQWIDDLRGAIYWSENRKFSILNRICIGSGLELKYISE
jgi:hypothetical protein